MRHLGRATRRLLILTTLLGGLCFASPVQACPACKDSLPNEQAVDPAERAAAGTARGYYYSILFMLATPFILVGGMGTMFYFTAQKAKVRRPVNHP